MSAASGQDHSGRWLAIAASVVVVATVVAPGAGSFVSSGYVSQSASASCRASLDAAIRGCARVPASA